MPNETKPVKLFRRGQLLEIVPPVDGLIENTEFLNYEYVGCASVKEGFTLKTKRYSLIWPNTDMYGHQYLQTFAGFEPEVRAFLKKLNKKYILTGDRPKPLPEPTWTKLPGNKTGDRRLLRFVQHHERGLILYRESNIDIAWIIAQIAFAYPKEEIVVIATRQADAAILAGRLRKYMSGISVAKPLNHPDNPSRVVIVTTSGLQQNGVEVMKRTICICLNPTEVLSDKKVWFSSKDWLPVLKSRIYGLLNEDHSIAPQHLFLMRSIFGAPRLFIPKHGFRKLPVHVTTWTFKGSNKLSVHATTLDIKKELIWRNPTRNRLIAGLAKAITESDDKALTKKYKSIAKALYSKLGQRVAIMVENVEHAARLHHWLLDWPIVAGKGKVSNTTKLNPKVMAAIEAGKQTTARKFDDIIVTTQGFAELGAVEILIRADAGTGLPPVSPEYFVSGDMVPASLTIIDVNDRHHPHLRQRTKWRRISYRERGWKVDGCDRLSNHVDCADYTPEGLHPGRRRVTSGSYLPRQKGDRKIRTGQEAFAQRRKKRKRQQLLDKGVITLKLIADHEFLLQCFKKLRSEGGWGAGKDGISFASLSPGEWVNVFRTLSKTLLRSRYRPLEARKVPIPKPATSEKRILSIRSICDRVVAKALYTLLEPHMNQLFLNGSWGFRRERGTLQMLDQMKRRIQETGRTVLVIDDVRNAFDSIHLSDLLKSHRKAQKDLAKKGDKSSVKINDSVIKLIAVMAQDTDQSRTIGIDQGNNYSPTALNVLLHYVHDLPITSAFHFPFWFRYADNLAYLCQDVAEGHHVRQKVQHLLGKSKLELKGEGGGIFDLQMDTATLLGFGLQIKDNELSFTLTEQAWKNLELQLAESHNALNPSKIALEVITGWVNAFGMAFENDGSDVAKILEVAAQYGFLEVDQEHIDKVVAKANARWEKMTED